MCEVFLGLPFDNVENGVSLQKAIECAELEDNKYTIVTCGIPILVTNKLHILFQHLQKKYL